MSGQSRRTQRHAALALLCRRASENDEELLQVLADGLGRWIATCLASDRSALPRVLVADDDPKMRELLQGILGKAYDVVPAEDGAQAIAKAQADHPDLILLDLKMPGVGGYAVCRTLKGDPQTRKVPILILTALDAPADKVKGLDLGADDSLTKPFDVEELKARVRLPLRRTPAG